MDTTFCEVRTITLPQGQLEIEMTERFVCALRQHFNVAPDAVITDEQVQAYVIDALNNAVVKAEREVV